MIKPVVESLPGAIVDLTEETLIRVLHVDDDADFLNTAKQILEMQSSFQVETARSVEEAKDKMKEKTFDVIVSDYVMPGKNGLDFLKELRDSGCNIPFILFTGKGREEVAIKALNLGVDGYFNKLGHSETVYGELAHGIRSTVKSKQEEQALKESEEKYRYLFANMLNGFAYCRRIFDEKDRPIDFVYLEVNDAFEKLTGLKKEDVIGKKVTEAIPGTEKANPELFDIYSRVALTGKEEEFEIFFKPLNMWLSISVYSPKKGYFVAVFENITERKQAEEALKESEEKFRNLVELSPDTIAVHREGKIVYVNAAGAKLLRAKNPEQLIGKSIMDFLHPSFRGIVKKRVQQIEEEGNRVPIIEEKFIRLDGTVVDVEVAAIPFTHNGKPATIAITRDITERKKAEEQLRSNVLILENIADSIIVTDLEGRITSWNEGASKIFGFSAEEMLGETIAKVSKPEEREQVAPAQLEQIRKGVLFFGEWEGVKKDGEPVWLMLTTKLLKNSQGETIGMIGVGKDVTERKKAEKTLQESEEKFRAIFEGANDGILAADPKTKRFAFANPRICEMTCYSLEELLRLSIADIHPKKDLPYVIDQFTKQMQGKITLSKDIPVLRKDERVVYCDVNSKPIKIGSQEYLVGFFRDVTERKKAEEELRESAEKYRTLVENTSDFIFMIDDEDKVLSINKSAARLFREKPEEVMGKSIFELFPKEIATGFSKNLKDVFKTGGGKVAESKMIAGGKEMWINSNLSPVKDHEGKVVAVMGVTRDFTERKMAEESLNRIMKELVTTNEKLNVVGKLTRHDVRNKLSAILNNIYLTKKTLTGDHEALKYLGDVESAFEEVGKIFEFARIYEMLGTEELDYVDVSKSVDEAVMLFSNLHGAKAVNNCHGLTVLADSLVRQLFYNLIDNSLKYGKKVSQIRMYYEKVGKDQMKLVYEDDGVGIPEAEKGKLFKEGYGKGTGYGLYLIRKMCEIYGWTIQETGKQRKGAQFTITIPAMNENGKIAYQLH